MATEPRAADRPSALRAYDNAIAPELLGTLDDLLRRIADQDLARVREASLPGRLQRRIKNVLAVLPLELRHMLLGDIDLDFPIALGSGCTVTMWSSIRLFSLASLSA
jgi:hypothetical protein